MRASQFKDRVDALLLRGLRDLSMTLGVLARIEDDNYEIVAVQSNSGAYVPGEKYELGDSYCRRVFEQRKVVAETRIDNSPQNLLHPLYRSLPLEAYLGMPIVIEGQTWGVLDFSSMAQRDDDFSEQDLKLVQELSDEITQLIGSTE